ncbi:DUF4377 domain-containing protein [Cecembia lonarensis]
MDEGKWTYFYSQIEGFDFKPGSRYRIKVKTEELP